MQTNACIKIHVRAFEIINTSVYIYPRNRIQNQTTSDWKMILKLDTELTLLHRLRYFLNNNRLKSSSQQAISMQCY